MFDSTETSSPENFASFRKLRRVLNAKNQVIKDLDNDKPKLLDKKEFRVVMPDWVEAKDLEQELKDSGYLLGISQADGPARCFRHGTQYSPAAGTVHFSVVHVSPNARPDHGWWVSFWFHQEPGQTI